MHFKDGILIFKLKYLTLFTVGLIQITFLVMLYTVCSNQTLQCDSQKIPLISDVIALPIMDRIFLLLNTVYFVCIHQINVRVFYKLLHEVIHPKTNTCLLISGLLSSFSLPMLGVFDNKGFFVLHHLIAALFFGSAAFYLTVMCSMLKLHKA